MHAIYPAHPITIVIIVAAMLVTPLYMLALYVFSGADPRKGAMLGALWLVFGAMMTAVCLWGVPARLGLPGNLVVPIAWFTPSVLLIVFRKWALERPLSQRWLIALQLWRAIGAVFLIEMARGHIPPVFAYPAGLGDVFAALVALGALVAFRGNLLIPRWAIITVAVVGIADFLSAFFFGFTSSEGPQNLFPQDSPSRVIEFPTGMIPLFLVPYAIFFHTLSMLSLRGPGSINADAPAKMT
ncbi:MAG: hypothetical protein C0513_07795 [Isosphaera sp.]|nr:hypothetical protein [Isosphaera sp.]